jgi:hypothetical protein
MILGACAGDALSAETQDSVVVQVAASAVSPWAGVNTEVMPDLRGWPTSYAHIILTEVYGLSTAAVDIKTDDGGYASSRDADAIIVDQQPPVGSPIDEVVLVSRELPDGATAVLPVGVVPPLGCLEVGAAKNLAEVHGFDDIAVSHLDELDDETFRTQLRVLRSETVVGTPVDAELELRLIAVDDDEVIGGCPVAGQTAAPEPPAIRTKEEIDAARAAQFEPFEMDAPQVSPWASADTAVMPDLTGLSLQYAQDLMQGLWGIILIDTYDVTGAARVAILDAGWVVLEQTIAAGSALPEAPEDGSRIIDGLEVGIARFGEEGTSRDPENDGVIPAIGCLDGQLALDILQAHGYVDVDRTDPRESARTAWASSDVAVGVAPDPGTAWLPDRSVSLLLVEEGTPLLGC